MKSCVLEGKFGFHVFFLQQNNDHLLPLGNVLFPKCGEALRQIPMDRSPGGHWCLAERGDTAVDLVERDI